jgi:hypothetical protein
LILGLINYNIEAAWFKKVAKLTHGDGTIFILDLLTSPGLMFAAEFSSCWWQVLWQLCMRLELAMRRSGSMQKCPWPVHCSSTQDEVDWSARAVDLTCSLHREASRAATIGWQNFGLACDKVSARGQELQNSFMVLPNNIAFELVPQAGL